MEIGELGNTLAADVLKFWMDCENRMLVNHQVKKACSRQILSLWDPLNAVFKKLCHPNGMDLKYIVFVTHMFIELSNLQVW